MLLECARVHQCARDLFDKKRHAVAALHELAQHFAGHRLAVRDASNHGLDLGVGETRHVDKRAPRRWLSRPGLNSGRAVKSPKRGSCSADDTSSCNTSSVEGSAQ